MFLFFIKIGGIVEILGVLIKNRLWNNKQNKKTTGCKGPNAKNKS